MEIFLRNLAMILSVILAAAICTVIITAIKEGFRMKKLTGKWRL